MIAIADVLAIAMQLPILEREVLLAYVLNVSREYLHTWPEKILTSLQQETFLALVQQRLQGEPIAYLIGRREFWSLDLLVTKDVLIPRPETELLVELVLEKVSAPQAVIADLGTGSGAIALALARERPHWIIHAVDASFAALQIAKANAERLQINNVIFYQGDWCEPLPLVSFDAIVSNPPYIAEGDVHLSQGDLRFEPMLALMSGDEGLQDIKEIIFNAREYLKNSGFLFLEHGFQQAKNVASILTKAGYTDTETCLDLTGWERVTFASWMRF